MRTVPLVVLAACATGAGAEPFADRLRDATTANADHHDRAAAALRARAAAAPFEPALDVIELTQVAAPTEGLRGLLPGEQLHVRPDGELVFEGRTCVRGSSCGCEVSREYAFARQPDGHVVISRLTPVITVHEVRVKAKACGTGCGQPPVPLLRTAARLGVTHASELEIVEQRYPYELVIETCAHPMPRA